MSKMLKCTLAEIFDHSSYSSDLASRDYYLFLHLKKWLVSQWCDNDDELKNGINE